MRMVHTIPLRIWYVPYAYGIKYAYGTEQLHKTIICAPYGFIIRSTLQVTIVHTMNIFHKRQK